MEEVGKGKEGLVGMTSEVATGRKEEEEEGGVEGKRGKRWRKKGKGREKKRTLRCEKGRAKGIRSKNRRWEREEGDEEDDK